FGDAGDDVLVGGSADDFLYGGTGNDGIAGFAGNDYIIGGSEVDIANVTDNDSIDGGLGDDYILGGSGNDTIVAGKAMLEIGETDNDYVDAGIGDDTVLGMAGSDWILGGAGDDRIQGGSGDDFIFGGDESNVAEVTQDTNGNDITIFHGDIIAGGEGADVLLGEGGNDTFNWQLGDGADTYVSGGSGTDSFAVTTYSRDQYGVISAATDDTIKVATALANDTPTTFSFAGAGPVATPISRTETQSNEGIKTQISGSTGTYTLISTEIENFAFDVGDGADTVIIGDLRGNVSNPVASMSIDLGTSSTTTPILDISAYIEVTRSSFPDGETNDTAPVITLTPPVDATDPTMTTISTIFQDNSLSSKIGIPVQDQDAPTAVADGEIWKINVDNTEYTYTTNGADGLTREAVANGLARAINTGSTYAATGFSGAETDAVAMAGGNDNYKDSVFIYGGQATSLFGEAGLYGDHSGDHDAFDVATNYGNVEIERSVIDDNDTPDDFSDDIFSSVMNFTILNAQRDLNDPFIVGDTATFTDDNLTIVGQQGHDQIIARNVDDNLIALNLQGGIGNDKIIGSDFGDVIDGGEGDDKLTGGAGVDFFLDSSGNDTLIETFDQDISLFGNTLVVGTILGNDGNALTKFSKIAEQEANDAAKNANASITIRDTGNANTATNYQVSLTAPASANSQSTLLKTGNQWEIKLQGDVKTNQVWSLTVDGTTYRYTAGADNPDTNDTTDTDPLSMVVVASRLSALINSKLKDTGDDDNTRYAAEDAAPEPIIFGLKDEDRGDRYATGAEVESLINASGEQIFENARLTGGDSSNVLVVNDSDNFIIVEGQSVPHTTTFAGITTNVTAWTGKVILDNKGSDSSDNEYYLITLKGNGEPGSGASYFIEDNGGTSGYDETYVFGTDGIDKFSLNAAGGGIGIVSSGDFFAGNTVDGTGFFAYKVSSVTADANFASSILPTSSTPNPERSTRIQIQSTLSLSDLQIVRGVTNVTDSVLQHAISEGGINTANWTLTADDPDEVANPENGFMEAGITWKVSLGGVVYSYTTMAGDTDASVAAQFEYLIQGNNPDREDVKFSAVERLTLRTFGGADEILVNDTAIQTIIETGSGADNIVIGSVPQIPDRGNADLNNPTGIPIADIKHMSNGNSADLFVYGGIGDDQFEVNHNSAAVFLFGEENDDTFIVNTFLVLNDDLDNPGSISNLTKLFGGTGSNRYVYLQNAPVNIFGGSGVDTVVVNGTAIADTFVITEKFVAGAGRLTFFSGIEKLEVNASGGDDDIYVLAAPAHLEVTIRGGNGDDKIHLGGDHPTLFFDPPAFIYQPPSFDVQDLPYIEFNVLQYDPSRIHKRISWWSNASDWDIFKADTNGVVGYVERQVTSWVNSWYQNNKERWRYIDVRYEGGLDGLILDTLNTIQWNFSWGSWWRFDPYIDFSFDMPLVNVEYGQEVTPPLRTVTPPQVTVDPDPFALKIDAVHTLEDIQGRILVDDTSGDDTLIVHSSESQALTGGLINASYLKIARADDTQLTQSITLTGSNLGGQTPVISNLGSKVEILLPETEILAGDSWTLTIDGNEFSYLSNVVDGLNSAAVVNSFEQQVNSRIGTTWTAQGNAYYNLQGLGLRQGSVNGNPFNGVLVGGVDEIDIRLSQYNDEFTLDIWQVGETPTDVQLVLNAGNDQVQIKAVSGETNILGGTGNDTVTVANDRQEIDEVVANLTFDGDGSIAELSSAIVYHADTHDAILDAVPSVFVNTLDGIINQQYKEAILDNSRTAHLTILPNSAGDMPVIGTLGSGIELLNRPIGQLWSDTVVSLQGTVVVGDVWILRLDGVDYDYKVQSGESSLDQVAAGLISRVNLLSSVYKLGVNTNDFTAINVSRVDTNPFTVQMIRGLNVAATLGGTLFSNFVQLELKGAVNGQSWSVKVGNSTYTGTGSTLQQIAQSLQTQINGAGFTTRVDQYLDIYTVTIDAFTGKPIEDFVQRRGEQAQGYVATGFQLYGYGLKGYDNAGSIVIDQMATNAQWLFEDAMGELTLTDTGKQAIVLTDQNNAFAVALYISANGTLTTNSVSGVQALQMMETSNTPVPLYYKDVIAGGAQELTTLTSTVQVSHTDVKALQHDDAVQLQYDQSGNVALSHPLLNTNGSVQTGFQVKGYQQYGYFSNGVTKSTTNIGADYNLVQTFNDTFAVPLYVRTDSLGNTQITTENIEDATFIDFKDAVAGTTITLTGQNRSFSDIVDSSGTARIVIPTNNIVGGRTWTLTVDGTDTYTYVTGTNGDALTSLAIAKGLALAESQSENDYITNGEIEFTRAYIKYNWSHGIGLGYLSVQDVNEQPIYTGYGVSFDQQLYLDANGNLTTANTGDATEFRGSQRTDSAGNKLYIKTSVNTVVDELTTVASQGHQQAIIVTNQQLYLDKNGAPTTIATNNPQWIVNGGTSAGRALHDFNANGSVRADEILYADADGNETTRIRNPFVVLVSADASGNYPSDSQALYLDENGYKTTQPTANKAYGATDDNSAPLIWYNVNGLDVETGDPLSVPRVDDNGTLAGTALYDLADNQQAIIPVDRLGLSVAIRPLEVYQSDANDAGIDRLIIDNRNTSISVDGDLDYNAFTDTTTVSGFTSLFMGIGLEAIEIQLGNQADIFDINSTAITTILHTNGGEDVVTVKSINATTSVYTGNDNDTINVGNSDDKLEDIGAQLIIDAGNDADTININNAGSSSSSSGTLTSTQITGLDMAGSIVYSATAEELNIMLGIASDDFFVQSSYINETNIFTGLGADIVTVANSNSTLAGITGALNITASTDLLDSLILDNSGTTDTMQGQLSDTELVGLGMASGGLITFTNLLDLTLTMGSGVDELTVNNSITGLTTINSGDKNDTIAINITQASGNIVVDTGAGQDNISLTQVAAVEHITLIGGEGADRYELKLYATAAGDIEVVDVEATDANSAGNSLVISTNDVEDESDNFLFRDALLYRFDTNQRIDYSGFTTLSLSTYGGNDSFVFDDTNTLVTVDAGAGDDSFQLGQVFESERDMLAGLQPNEYFDTELTTKGYLSNGVSYAATLLGGDGEDTFTVYSNKASIKLEGGADNDSFLVRSFVLVDPNDPLAPITSINGGDGADYISYAINSPVRIVGGDGLDTLTVVGTEFADDYVITDEGIYGAGRYNTYEGIEQIIVDGLEGNDEFFIFSTPADTELKLIGGLGSDTFNIGDGADGGSVAVDANDLEGYNSLIEHSVGDVIKTLSAKVYDEDEAGVRLIPLSNSNIIFEDDRLIAGALTYVQYAVVLTRPPKGVVSFKAAVALAEGAEDGLRDEAIEQPKGILLNGNEGGVSLLFDKSNWFKQQIITVTAPADNSAFNQGVEGLQTYEIQHKIIEDGAVDGDEYDYVEVNSFVVEVVDSQTPNVVVIPVQKQLIVGELDSGQANYAEGYDTYQLVLSKAPTEDVTVNISPYSDVDLNVSAQLTTDLVYVDQSG
ncbi:MAG: hypothetical protein JKX76_04465, partial [Colwellia sp.]|nr:hypothetical protein [Colwellia sp.]